MNYCIVGNSHVPHTVISVQMMGTQSKKLDMFTYKLLCSTNIKSPFVASHKYRMSTVVTEISFF